MNRAGRSRVDIVEVGMRMVSGWLALGVVLALPASAADEWKLDKESDGIKILVKDDPGYSLKAFQGRMRVKAGLAAPVALIADVEGFPAWYTDCAESRLIKKNGKEFVSYFVNDSPFPVMDRDTITRTVISQDPTTKAIRFQMKADPAFMPEKSNYVRVPKFEGYWLFTPISDTETDVLWEIHSDSGGSVPSFLANQQVTVGPFKTLKNMRLILEKPRYKNATVDFDAVAVTYGK